MQLHQLSWRKLAIAALCLMYTNLAFPAQPEPAPLPSEVYTFPQRSDWSKQQSDELLAFLSQTTEKANLQKKLEDRIIALNGKTAIQKMSFQRGNIFVDAGNLIWEPADSSDNVIIAYKDEHPGRGIGGILISPDGSMVAYSTTNAGSDENLWYVKTIAKAPVHRLAIPLIVRMDGFSWGTDNNTLYYSHFAKKEDVVSGKQPIVQVRSHKIDSGEEQTVFNPGWAENFEIYDVDGGKTLIAHRILGRLTGIKVYGSAFLGKLGQDEQFSWTPLIKRNQSLSYFLGVLGKGDQAKALFLSDYFGPTYGLMTVSLSDAAAVPHNYLAPKKMRVMNSAQLLQGKLFIEYSHTKTLKASMEIVDSNSLSIEKSIRFSDLGLVDLAILSVPVSFQGPNATFKYTDYLNNNTILNYNFADQQLTALPNPQPSPFNGSNVRAVVTTYRSIDGTRVPAIVLYKVKPNGNAIRPKFVFFKSYGAISVINRPEAVEAQMTLELGGAYVAMAARGGGSLGSDWFRAGAADLGNKIEDMAAASVFIRKRFKPFKPFELKPRRMVTLGRSWNGMGHLILAAKYPKRFGMFFSIVPVVNLEKDFTESWFGRIAHSDLAPKVDPTTGNLVLDQEFWDYAKQYNPMNMIEQIPIGTKLFMNISQFDDRVDQRDYSYEFAQKMKFRLGDDFKFFEREGASHGNRAYLPLVFGLIADQYKLDLP